jgi:hypothetical protein
VKINQLVYLLIPVIAVATPMYTDEWGEKDGTGQGIVIGRSETTTSPGGFSSVAEPGNPSGTKSTEQSPLLRPQARSTSTSLTPTALLQIR